MSADLELHHTFRDEASAQEAAADLRSQGFGTMILAGPAGATRPTTFQLFVASPLRSTCASCGESWPCAVAANPRAYFGVEAAKHTRAEGL